MRRLLFLWVNLVAATAFAGTQTQTILLQPGWNAIWLEVEPQDADGAPLGPAAVFDPSDPALAGVQTVARYVPALSTQQSLNGPGEGLFGGADWLVWRRNSIVAEDSLASMVGNAAYLIQNGEETPVSITLTGAVKFHRYQWTPNSFNLFGVPMDASATAFTFKEFFGPSDKHPLNQIFKLVDGSWVGVSPDEQLTDNAAYWVYCDGGSAYQGPLPVLFPDDGGYLSFGDSLETVEISAANLRGDPAGLAIERLVNGGLEVADARNGASIIQYEFRSGGLNDPVMRPRATESVRLMVTRPVEPAEAELENLYRFVASTEGGHSYFQYLPMVATFDVDLEPISAGAPLQGLWVGEVRITHVTSLVEGQVEGGETQGGPRLEPVGRPLNYRVILHADFFGGVNLLSHATVLQRQQVGEDLPREFVVVVDDNRIIDFVGIEERNGRQVGRRFDTVGYDLPRNPIAPSGSNPVNLDENYLLKLPMDGMLAPGGVVATRDGTFVIDEWHRTNPYKHVFNPNHRQGFRITREMAFQVAAAGSPEADAVSGFGVDALTGVFEEEITGLMKSGDVHKLRGVFLLNRVTDEAQLY